MPPTQDQTSLAFARQIDQLCDSFESRWQAGERPRAEEYLGQMPEEAQGTLLLSLLLVELELLAREGKRPAEDEYRGRFPQLESVVGRAFATFQDKVTSGETSITQDSVPASSPVITTQERQTPEAIGRFVVLRVLGEGAFGTVYLAHDPRLDRQVAIKVPKVDVLGDSFDTDRFLREARTTASLRHANICPVYEADVHEGRPFIVMAYVGGQPLDALLRKSKRLPEKQAAMVTRRLALALQAAHDQGIVHRDLKPANIIFDRDRKDVMVMDFGLARGPRLDNASATQSGVILGTPAYMSPEQARGEARNVGPAADIYSLGVMLYEMLTGQRPFQGTVTEVLGQILHVEPEPPSKVRPGADPQLAAICLKAMAKNPQARFGSMKELAAALDAWLRSFPGTAVETAIAADTREDVEGATEGAVAGSTERVAEVVDVMLTEQSQEWTTETGHAARQARRPRWPLVVLALLLVGGIAVLAGITFFARTKSATVLINVDVDLSDRTLSFFLDRKPIEAASLAKPMELTLGEHELLIKRGEDVLNRFLFRVRGGASPSIEIQEAQDPQPKDGPVSPDFSPTFS